MKSFVDFVQALQVTIKYRQLYSDQHPLTADALKNLQTTADLLLAGVPRFQVVVSRGKLFLEGIPEENLGPQLTAFLKLLSERNLSGFVFLKGVTSEELAVLVRVLSLKPQKLDEAGGAATVLTQADVTHIRVSHVRYEELRDGEVLVSARTAATMPGGSFDAGDQTGSRRATFGGFPSPGAGGAMGTSAAQILGFLSEHMTAAAAGDTGGSGAVAGASPFEQIRAIAGDDETAKTLMARAVADYIRNLTDGAGEGSAGTDSASGVIPHTNLASAAAGAGSIGFQGADVSMHSKLKEALSALPAEAKAKLVVSRETLPPGELRSAVDQMLPDLVADAVSSRYSEQQTGGAFFDFTSSLLSFVDERNRALETMKQRLTELGIRREQFEELLNVLAWENLSLDEKVEKATQQAFIFELPSEKVLVFFEQLFAAGRVDDSTRVLERYATALFNDSEDLRATVTDNFHRIAAWGRNTEMPAAFESMFERILLTHLLREPSPKVASRCSESIEILFVTWFTREKPERVYGDLRKIEAALTVAATQFPWKKHIFDSLLDRLSSVDRIKILAQQIYSKDPETVASQYHPLLAFFGGRAAAALLDILGVEEDRGHRGRLVRAIKAIGKPALQNLKDTLSAGTWYLVRNTLNVLGDLNAVDLLDDIGATLKHDDIRVQKAAARTLAKTTSVRAERYLVDALTGADSELQTEILSCLGSMKAATAVAAVVELTRPKRLGIGDDRIRIRAVETLGQIGSAEAVAPLHEVLKRRGSVLAGVENPEVRLAAAKALIAIGTPEARAALRGAINAEPSGAMREALERLVPRSVN